MNNFIFHDFNKGIGGAIKVVKCYGMSSIKDTLEIIIKYRSWNVSNGSI